VDGVDSLPVGGGEGEVHLPGLGPRGRAEPEGRPAVRAGEAGFEAVRMRHPHRLAHADRGEHPQVEAQGGVDVGDLEKEMIEHGEMVASRRGGQPAVRRDPRVRQ